MRTYGVQGVIFFLAKDVCDTEPVLPSREDKVDGAGRRHCKRMEDMEDGRSVAVIDSTGRVGNHLFAYNLIASARSVRVAVFIYVAGLATLELEFLRILLPF